MATDGDLDALLDDAMDEAMCETDDDLDALLDDALDSIAEVTAPPTQPTPKPQPIVKPEGDVERVANPMTRLLEDTGIPPHVALDWSRNIVSDHALQKRAEAQRPFSRAYSSWSDKGPSLDDMIEGTRAGLESSGNNNSHGHHKSSEDDDDTNDSSTTNLGSRMFGESLQMAVRKGHFQSASISKSVTAALHGKGANKELVERLQQLYLNQVLRDVVPRLKSDPDRMAAAREGRFPLIQEHIKQSSRGDN